MGLKKVSKQIRLEEISGLDHFKLEFFQLDGIGSPKARESMASEIGTRLNHFDGPVLIEVIITDIKHLTDKEVTDHEDKIET